MSTMSTIDLGSLGFYGNSLNDKVKIFKGEIYENTRFLKLAAANNDYADVSFIANYIGGICASVSAKHECDLAKRVELSADLKSQSLHDEVALLITKLNRLMVEIDPKFHDDI